MSEILANRIQTPDGTILESQHRHDYVTHIDSNGHMYSTDGGLSYTRRAYSPDAPAYKDLSVYSDDSHETIRNGFSWGAIYDKDMNLLPDLVYIFLKDMKLGHIQAILSGGHAQAEHIIKVFEDELAYREELCLEK
jgi:hypothetical protein